MAEQDAGPRLLPILGWLRTYDRRWLRGDLIAGVTVAALIVPKNLGYAEIAGIQRRWARSPSSLRSQDSSSG